MAEQPRLRAIAGTQRNALPSRSRTSAQCVLVDRAPRPCESSGADAGAEHTNYFFEWCVWFGFAIYGVAYAPWGLLALLGQAIILASILGVAGIPPTENQALRSKGEAYRAYQTRVSRFVPMPPKSRRNDT